MFLHFFVIHNFSVLAKQSFNYERTLTYHHHILGDPLSSALCNVYFGHLAKTHLQNFSRSSSSSDSIFARGMDDFIFVTFKREKAETFLQRMHKVPSIYYVITWRGRVRGALCFERGFTRTFPWNQDVAVK